MRFVLTTKPSRICCSWPAAVQIVDPQLDHLNLSGSKDEKQMIQGYAAIYAKQIGDLLLRMPRPLLLLLKTNDCLRSVDLSLGGPCQHLRHHSQDVF